jgi:hypothetical protein
MAEAKSPVICETCDRPWPEGTPHPGTFARFPNEDPPAPDDLDTLITEQSRLSDFARVTFHAIFCVWHYEHEALSGMEYESVEPLTCLGQQLCREIGRYESQINRAALKLESALDATGQTAPTQPERGA